MACSSYVLRSSLSFTTKTTFPTYLLRLRNDRFLVLHQALNQQPPDRSTSHHLDILDPPRHEALVAINLLHPILHRQSEVLVGVLDHTLHQQVRFTRRRWEGTSQGGSATVQHRHWG